MVVDSIARSIEIGASIGQVLFPSHKFWAKALRISSPNWLSMVLLWSLRSSCATTVELVWLAGFTKGQRRKCSKKTTHVDE